MTHRVVIDQTGVHYWPDHGSARQNWPDLTAGLDTLHGPVTVTALHDIGQDRMNMPIALSGLRPLPQVLPSGHEVAIWPALTANDPPAFVPSTAPLAGLLAVDPEFDGVACIVADATHWVRISAGEACFAQSDISRSLLSLPGTFNLDDAELRAGFARTEGRGASLGAELAKLVAGPVADTPSYRLGLAIGAETAAAKPYWLGQAVTVLAEDPLRTAYGLILNDLGCQTAAMSLHQAARI